MHQHLAAFYFREIDQQLSKCFRLLHNLSADFYESQFFFHRFSFGLSGDTTPPVGGDLALKFQADSGYKIQTVVFAGDTIFDADTTASVYGPYNFALGNYQPPRTFDFTAEFVAY